MYDQDERYRWVVAVLCACVLLFAGVVLVVPHLIPESKPIPKTVAESLQPIQVIVEELEPDQQTRQIVSIDAPETERPTQADYEDRVNRSVEEETVAPNRNAGQPTAVPGTRREEQSRSQQRRQREERTEQSDDDPAEQDESLDTIALAPRLDETNPNRQQARPEPEVDLSAFSPSFGTAQEFIAVPGVPQIDHLDLPQGERTQLNSFENLYWSYWDRIKTQVRPHWIPARAYRQRDPTGRVYGVEDRYTVVRVTLNGDGSLRHVFLERSSELDFLDREAIRAIQNAEPFSNVPEGLKDDRGLLSFRFGFYFEVGTTNFRIRREDW